LLIGGAALLAAQPCAAGSAGFVKAGRLITPRAEQQAVLLTDGKVLVVGGQTDRFQTLARAELFDPLSKSWRSTGSMANRRLAFTATVLSDGRVLVAGGGDYPPYNPTAELYDPAIRIWAITGNPIAAKRANATATLLPNGQVLVAGGGDGSDLRTAELYDPATGTWSSTGDLSVGRSVHSATRLANGDVLVVGGFLADGSIGGSAETYHIATGQWTSAGSLAEGRYSHSATLLPDGTVLVAGGADHTSTGSTIVLASAEIFHPDTGTWSVTSSLAQARGNHTGTLLADGQVLVVGGFGANFVSLGTAELYQPATGNWTTSSAHLRFPRQGQSAVPLLDGTVLIAAGADVTADGLVTYPAVAEEYVSGAQ
jgi:WD40 repeat protein